MVLTLKSGYGMGSALAFKEKITVRSKATQAKGCDAKIPASQYQS
jgi:hypothetical protein